MACDGVEDRVAEVETLDVEFFEERQRFEYGYDHCFGEVLGYAAEFEVFERCALADALDEGEVVVEDYLPRVPEQTQRRQRPLIRERRVEGPVVFHAVPVPGRVDLELVERDVRGLQDRRQEFWREHGFREVDGGEGVAVAQPGGEMDEVIGSECVFVDVLARDLEAHFLEGRAVAEEQQVRDRFLLNAQT